MTSSFERTKICTYENCAAQGQPQPWSNFYAAAKWEDGTMRRPQARCKKCMAIFARRYQRARVVNDPEACHRENAARWQSIKNDPERYGIELARSRDFHARKRRERGAPIRPRCSSRERQAQRRTGESLPAGPFGMWLARVLAEYGNDLTRVAGTVGLSVETCRRIINGRVVSVDVGTVEVALAAVGSRMVGDLYG